MSEKLVTIYQFIDDEKGLKVSAGDTEALFLRDPDRVLTVSVTNWRPIVQSTDFKDRNDGGPTLLSHLLRIEAVGKLEHQKIEFVNGGPESGEIEELPITIR